ncbi:MAG TPA: proline--tRNA ligase [Terriglobales bacterium]|nr:proline--tRNA ligase [Terriglobales bacterium]
MRWSQAFIPTLREAPADAEVASHIFLLRAGYIRQLAAGIYDYLPLAWRSLLKIQAIVREEMDTIGQEFHLPALHPAEVWQASGRWELMGSNLFRLKDRFQRDLCLGMTEEEVMAAIASKELRSYKQLPQIWYQIQTKFRDEPRPRSGLLRVREFIMKDAYSFDVDEAGLDVSYQKHDRVYRRIFDRCGLRYVAVEAHSGAMGGSQSQEFMVLGEAGEDMVAMCAGCGYAANLEKAAGRPTAVVDPPAAGEPERFATPNARTIAELAAFTGEAPGRLAKSLVYMVEGQPVLVLVRGDDEASEAKLQTAFGGKEFRPAHAEEIVAFTGTPPGSVGPLQLKQPGRVLADAALQGRSNLTVGANQEGYHLRHVTPEVHFQPEWVDVRNVRSGDGCPTCGQALRVSQAIEVGHIFKLGRKYSLGLGVRVLDAQGGEVVPIMGSYGIGMERILTAAIEQNHDQDGFWLPAAIAPYEVVITPTNLGDAAVAAVSQQLYDELRGQGRDVLLDDRDERPGVKFKDADLVGIPTRITVGKKAAQGIVELVDRASKTVREVAATEVAAAVGAARA